MERLYAPCDAGQSPASPVCTSEQCAKDVGSYAYRFAQKYGINTNFQYLACTGADTSDVTKNQIGSPYFGNPDLVTVQVGGDDYETFYNVLFNCTAFPDQQKCNDTLTTANSQLPQIVKNVNATLSAINARVKPATPTKALVGYVQFFGSDYSSLCTSFAVPTTVKQAINALVVKANQNLAVIAKQQGFLFVNADDAYAGHRWCDSSQEPWWIIKDLFQIKNDTHRKSYLEKDYGHPTDQGQAAYLLALEKRLGL